MTVEEGCVAGGAGEGVLETLSSLGEMPATLVLGLPDAFVEQGDFRALFARLGLDGAGIAAQVAAKLS